MTMLLEAEEELKIGREDLDHGWTEYYDGLEELQMIALREPALH